MGLLEGQALVEDEVVSVGLYLASWRLTEISDEYWTLLDQACVSLNVLYLAGFFSFLRAKPVGREERLAGTEEERDGGEEDRDPTSWTQTESDALGKVLVET